MTSYTKVLDQDQVRPTWRPTEDQQKRSTNQLKTNLRPTGDQLETNQRESLLMEMLGNGLFIRVWLRPF